MAITWTLMAVIVGATCVPQADYRSCPHPVWVDGGKTPEYRTLAECRNEGPALTKAEDSGYGLTLKWWCRKNVPPPIKIPTIVHDDGNDEQ